MDKKIEYVVQHVERAVMSTEKMIDPVRQSIFKRFPIMLTLLVAFGMSATFYGIERLIGEIAWLSDRPFFILIFGLSALIITGKLYQKLG